MIGLAMAYFWESSPERGLEFARSAKLQKKYPKEQYAIHTWWVQ
jgi:hypothetical protein